MRGHYIKPNHNTETIHNAIFVDTETDQIQTGPWEIGHILAQGMAAHVTWHPRRGWRDPDWIRFTDVEDFWEWTESKTRPKTKLYVFCHNSNFDYPVLDAFRWLPEHKWEAKRLVIEGPPTIIQLRKNDRTLLLLDTLNWWRTPLRALGKSLGLPKLEMPSKDAPIELWDTYNRRDVEIIMLAVQRWCDFLREHDLGGFASTLAGQSLRTFRHRFMTHKILIDDNDKALACSRACYHGGRTEAWFIGKTTGNFHLVDVNSMYPYVMHKYKYPTILRWYTSVTSPQDLRESLRKYLICARVKVYLDSNAVPISRDGKLVYPTGVFDAALSTPQLKYVLKHGEILKVYDMALYSGQPIFKRFVDYIYKARLEAKAKGDEVLSNQWKVLLNSLYGKFGQRGIVFTEVDITDDLTPRTWREYDADTLEIESYRQIMGVISQLQREPESGASHPAIAAHVTAHASMYLFNLATLAGHEHVYYMDTDSLLLDDTGLERLKHLIDQTTLGMIKHEGTFDSIEIFGAKDYRFGGKVRIKGVKSNATWLESNVAQQEKWSGLKGLIASGQAHLPKTEKVVKILKRTYDKGVVTPSGRVTPHCLGLPTI